MGAVHGRKSEYIIFGLKRESKKRFSYFSDRNGRCRVFFDKNELMRVVSTFIDPFIHRRHRIGLARIVPWRAEQRPRLDDSDLDSD